MAYYLSVWTLEIFKLLPCHYIQPEPSSLVNVPPPQHTHLNCAWDTKCFPDQHCQPWWEIVCSCHQQLNEVTVQQVLCQSLEHWHKCVTLGNKDSSLCWIAWIKVITSVPGDCYLMAALSLWNEKSEFCSFDTWQYQPYISRQSWRYQLLPAMLWPSA